MPKEDEREDKIILLFGVEHGAFGLQLYQVSHYRENLPT